ncbi:hypothetical protein MAPG_08156 [Magnaporthiopsis poae ATCC 64411]|uniref:Uncharacterized protein n=1 Tax=Magnaporthiopsis poae (strain ATCC 64411 / 73-15) TaxID=644358 RepID=A0A0C4E6L3_MAGP6|nr:hypothetical protein MAPG_08156 [Magnaporthiopsis poae ATCC 64411]
MLTPMRTPTIALGSQPNQEGHPRPASKIRAGPGNSEGYEGLLGPWSSISASRIQPGGPGGEESVREGGARGVKSDMPSGQKNIKGKGGSVDDPNQLCFRTFTGWEPDCSNDDPRNQHWLRRRPVRRLGPRTFSPWVWGLAKLKSAVVTRKGNLDGVTREPAGTRLESAQPSQGASLAKRLVVGTQQK